MDLRDTLSEALRFRQLTQADLAEATGIHPTQICKYCQGERDPSVSNLIRMAKALEVSTDFLLGLSLNPTTWQTYHSFYTTVSRLDKKSRYVLQVLAKVLADDEYTGEKTQILCIEPTNSPLSGVVTEGPVPDWVNGELHK